MFFCYQGDESLWHVVCLDCLAFRPGSVARRPGRSFRFLVSLHTVLLAHIRHSIDQGQAEQGSCALDQHVG